MKAITLRVTFILLVTVVLFVVTNGQGSEPRYWSPVEPFRIEVDRQNPEVRELLDRWDRIGNEAQGVTNGPAGTYLKSGYNGWLLRWAAHTGFVYVYHSEGLSIIDFSYGRVEETSSEIRFIPEREMRESRRGIKLNTPSIWVAAKSPQLKFVIPKDEIKDFGHTLRGCATTTTSMVHVVNSIPFLYQKYRRESWCQAPRRLWFRTNTSDL